MIHRLEMKGYRGFERYALANLARVNLLVGRNNSGKTAILEAVQLLADGDDFRILDEIARRRGETISKSPDADRLTPLRLAEVAHFFHGHSIGPKPLISLESNGDLGWRGFRIGKVGDDYAHNGGAFGIPAQYQALASDDLLHMTTGSEGSSFFKEKAIRLLEEGTLWPYGGLRKSETAAFGREEALVSLFVPSDSLERGRLVTLWDRIITEGDEGYVVEAMQILEPDLASIAFLSGERSSPSDPRGGVVIGFRGESRRRPLGSYGEGMRRLLVLAVALARTRNGVLLIDEVDTGLHYSILGDVWKLIVETAVRNDVQVFLTTHSLDCLRALDWLCVTRPDLADEVSVQKVDRRLDEAVALDASRLQIAVEQGIEVR